MSEYSGRREAKKCRGCFTSWATIVCGFPFRVDSSPTFFDIRFPHRAGRPATIPEPKIRPPSWILCGGVAIQDCINPFPAQHARALHIWTSQLQSSFRLSRCDDVATPHERLYRSHTAHIHRLCSSCIAIDRHII
jgi:hypothetical protein